MDPKEEVKKQEKSNSKRVFLEKREEEFGDKFSMQFSFLAKLDSSA